MDFIILEGEQKGARFSLKNDASLSIGSSFDDDIIIRDPLVQKSQLELVVSERTIELEVHSGNIQICGQSVEQGNRISLPIMETVLIGSTIFTINQKFESVSDTQINGLNSTSQTAKSFLNRLSKSIHFVFALSVLSIFLVVSSVIAASKFSSDEIIPSNSQRTVALQKLLHSSGFINTSVSFLNDTFVVSGYISSYQDFEQLQKLTAEHQIIADWNISVGEKIESDIANVYRINGISAEVTVIEPGIIQVHTTESDIAKLDLVKESVLEDVSDIKELKVINNAPKSITDEVNVQKNIFSDKGKRITMVVQGSPPYFVTADYSRYYVGSILPSGYIVEDITEKVVKISREGIITNLKI